MRVWNELRYLAYVLTHPRHIWRRLTVNRYNEGVDVGRFILAHRTNQLINEMASKNVARWIDADELLERLKDLI